MRFSRISKFDSVLINCNLTMTLCISDAKQHYFGANHRREVIRKTQQFGYLAPTKRFEQIPLKLVTEPG